MFTCNCEKKEKGGVILVSGCHQTGRHHTGWGATVSLTLVHVSASPQCFLSGLIKELEWTNPPFSSHRHNTLEIDCHPALRPLSKLPLHSPVVSFTQGLPPGTEETSQPRKTSLQTKPQPAPPPSHTPLSCRWKGVLSSGLKVERRTFHKGSELLRY